MLDQFFGCGISGFSSVDWTEAILSAILRMNAMPNLPPIPLVDLSRIHAELEPEFVRLLKSSLAKNDFIMGRAVENFEKAFAEFIGVKHTIGVSSGTDAIEIALRAAGIRNGDGVIVPANTFFATASAAVRAGGRPILADVHEDDFTIDVSTLDEVALAGARFILPVHLYGQPARMDEVEKFAKAREITIIEDAAQAHGASWQNSRCGTMGLASAFSFFPGKNLGALGDAGGITTDSDNIADICRSIRTHGSQKKYHHPIYGFNGRIDTIQAAFLLAKLPKLSEWNSQRDELAQRYLEKLGGDPRIVLPNVFPKRKHVFHLFVIRVKNRDRILERINAAGIGAAIHYPVPIHLHEAFSQFSYKKGDFPITESLAQEILSLPIFPGMTIEEIDRVCTNLIRVVSEES